MKMMMKKNKEKIIILKKQNNNKLNKKLIKNIQTKTHKFFIKKRFQKIIAQNLIMIQMMKIKK